MKTAIAPTPNETFPDDTPSPKHPPLQQTASLAHRP
jgi:hypothetical protein